MAIYRFRTVLFILGLHSALWALPGATEVLTPYLELKNAAPDFDDKTELNAHEKAERDAHDAKTRAQLSDIFATTQSATDWQKLARELEAVGHWSSTDTAGDINALYEARERGDITARQATGAVSKAEGQLESLSRMDNHLDAFSALGKLKSDSRASPRYLRLLDLGRVRAVESALFDDLTLLGEPLSQWRAARITGLRAEATTEAIDTLNNLIDHYAKNPTTTRERYFVNDLRYRRAVLLFLSGNPDWAKELGVIFATHPKRVDWYAPETMLDHVYVSRFFGINQEPKHVATFGDTSQGSEGSNAMPPLLRRANLNPAQLAAWTCIEFSEAEAEDKSPFDVLFGLSKFSNADFRVVLSHHNGKVGRYSKRSSEDLWQEAETVLSKIPVSLMTSPYGRRVPDIQKDPICGATLPGLTTLEPRIVETQLSYDNFYLAIDVPIDLIKARRVLATIYDLNMDMKRDGGIYLLRPDTRG